MLVSNTLPTTATRTDWQFAYLANPDPTALADGTLTVTEGKGKRVKRTVTTAYAVQEQPCRGRRALLLAKAAHAGDLDTAVGLAGFARCGEVYAVTVTPGSVTCTCPAGVTGKACKHGIALRELIATADLPSPFPRGDADAGDTERQPPVTHPAVLVS